MRSGSAVRWTRGQLLTLSALTIGYAGYYVCRSNLSVASPLLLESRDVLGVDKTALGTISSAAVLAYAVGKVINGIATDFASPRLVFLSAMVLSLGATIAFGLATGLSIFVLIWCANRFVQSAGWGAALKICGAWFDPTQYGRAAAILCMSYLFGDVLARLVLGQIIRAGAGWRGLFFASAAMLAVIAVGCAWVLRDRPTSTAGASNRALHDATSGDLAGTFTLRATLLPLLRSPGFLLLALLSLGLTMLRETFNFWSPTYLKEVGGLSNSDSATWSSVFPLFGGMSALLAGWISDRLTQGQRGLVMAAMLLPLVGSIGVMALWKADSHPLVPILMLGLSALFMIGPYSFLSGASSLDVGGARAAATAAGLLDGVGYLGAVLSGRFIGKLAQTLGWGAAMGVLAAIGLSMSVAALFYWRLERRFRRQAHPALVQSATEELVSPATSS